MTFSQEQQDKIIKLLKNDATRRVYIKDYMKEYRKKKKAETGVSQKQYCTGDDMKSISKNYYSRKTALNCIKFLFI